MQYARTGGTTMSDRPRAPGPRNRALTTLTVRTELRNLLLQDVGKVLLWSAPPSSASFGPLLILQIST